MRETKAIVGLGTSCVDDEGMVTYRLYSRMTPGAIQGILSGNKAAQKDLGVDAWEE